MFILAFHAFLRIGEITVRSYSASLLVLQLSDCRMHNAPPRTGLEISLTHFKGKVTGAPFAILLPPSKAYCPVDAVVSFIRVREASPGPPFIDKSGRPVHLSVFTLFLNATLRSAGNSPSLIKPHSFRIGAATSGLSDNTIALYLTPKGVGLGGVGQLMLKS